MYNLINKNAAFVVDAIPHEHRTDYEWLLQHVSESHSVGFQSRFRKFWAMNAAQLGPEFYKCYFDLLVAKDLPDLDQICWRLYDCSARRDGKKSLQFSFATKLVHMRDHHSPIFDSQICTFYFFQQPAPNGDTANRIAELATFHRFLVSEYKRVLQEGLLGTAIAMFRSKLSPISFTDEKVIDSLIWKTSELLRKGALIRKEMTYS